MEIKEKFSDFKYHISRFMTKRNQCLIFLVTLCAAAVSIYAAITHSFPEPVNITLYVFAGMGFICTCTLWTKAIIFFVKMVLLPFTRSNQIVNTLITDNRLRTVLFTVLGMGLNLIYAIFNGVIGIVNHSAWCGSLSAYYILLCVMRFLSVSHAKKVYDRKFIWKKMHKDKDNRHKSEDSLETRVWRVYRNCGIMLSISSIALGGAVIMLVSGAGGKSYPGLMIYAVATYTFYKLIMAVRNMILAGKEKALLLMTLRNISYADALVSLLSLQTALFAAFGQNSEAIIPIFNALTGAGVCLMIFVLGVYMIHKSKSTYKNSL